MRQVFVLALLLITQEVALDEHNEVKVIVESKLKDDEAAGNYLHKLERRSILSSEL